MVLLADGPMTASVSHRRGLRHYCRGVRVCSQPAANHSASSALTVRLAPRTARASSARSSASRRSNAASGRARAPTRR